MKSTKKALLVLLMAVFMVAAWQIVNITHNDDTDNGSETESKDKQKSETGEDETEQKALTEGIGLTLLVTGENFMHESVIESGKQSDGAYNYDYIFEGIQKYIDEADIAVFNQGSVIGGNELGRTGYPEFNAPEEICAAVEKAGFGVVLMATNRVNSQGAEAIKSCIDIWQEQTERIQILGIKKDREELNYRIVIVNGIRIAMLNYTYGVNIPMSGEDAYMVNFLGAVNETTGEVSETVLSSRVLSDIHMASEAADFVIVFPYWGNEYEYTPNELQRNFAKQMVEAGADLIIGTHPHYLQNVEWIEGENGNRGLCYYSLGNLISSQNYTGCMLGGLAQISLVVKNGEVVINEEKSGLIPVVTQYTYSGSGEIADVQGVIPYAEYTEELAALHGITERGGVEFSKSELQNILDSYIDEKFLLE